MRFNIRPELRWAGGKRRELKQLRTMFPDETDFYCEPFVGGGAVVFDLQPKCAIINDSNRDLMLIYKAIRDELPALMDELSLYKNDVDSYYQVRDIDKHKLEYESMSAVGKAARFLYLNKTCFNGVCRVNSRGEFNTSFGYRKNANILDETNLRNISAYLNQEGVALRLGDYKDALSIAPKGSFVFLDPPYDAFDEEKPFVEYTKDAFGRAEQEELKKQCDKLNKRGVNFMLCNAATPFILDAYKAYNINYIKARRNNCGHVKGRKSVFDVAIRNYTNKTEEKIK